MAEPVNAMVKVRNADKTTVDEFIRERFSDVFSSAKIKPMDDSKVAYKGGSFFKPYGFKAQSTVQSSSDDSKIVKLWGRPTMYPMAYLALIMLIGGIAGIIIDPVQNGFLAILILLFLILLRRERKTTTKKINQVLEEVKVRFS